MSAIYEILIRGNVDGTYAGASQTLWLANGDVGNPTAIDPATVSAILGASFPSLSTQLATANAQVNELKAELAAVQTQNPPDTPPIPTITFNRFMALFTPAEQIGIVNSTDTGVKLYLLQVAGAGDVALSDPSVAKGLNYLVALGLLTPERVAQIQAGQPT